MEIVTVRVTIISVNHETWGGGGGNFNVPFKNQLHDNLLYHYKLLYLV